jgi:Putative Phosphatase
MAHLQVIRVLHARDSIDMVIVSDANSVYIDSVLRTHGLEVSRAHPLVALSTPPPSCKLPCAAT